MPLYRCTSPAGTFDDRQRAEIATAITDIHCDLTGAPRTFVHVQFLHRPAQADGPRVVLHGGIRAGRDRALAQALIDRCIAAVASIGGLPTEQLTMRTSTTPASWILEGGHVLPEPGQELAWVAAHGAYTELRPPRA